MQIYETVQEIRNWRKANVREFQTIGFIPTMGCLHEGHLSLLRASIKENDFTIVSIFVNPSQFSPTEDLDKYPRTLSEDIALLKTLGVDVCFTPLLNEIYPQGIVLDITKQRGPFITVLGMSEQLEGITRPNFFRGVATIVAKLLNIVSPTKGYFGQKDIQQFIVLDTMVKELFIDTKLVMIPIQRDDRGLALSSRNKYLSQETLEISSNIYRGLSNAASKLTDLNGMISRQMLLDIIYEIWTPFVESGDFEVDYISIANMNTLLELETDDFRGFTVVFSCAVYVNDKKNIGTKVRLIDNIIIDNI